MDSESYDIVVIGGGPGGYVAALRGASLGAAVALVEEDLIGGTCLNRGCIPTKSLLESARLVRRITRAAEFGVVVDGARPDPQAIAARAQSVVGLMRKGVEDLLATRKVTVIKGRARLGSAGTVEVAGASGATRLSAKAVIVASGSSWTSLPGVVVDGQAIITSDHALDLKRPRGTMVIVGGGAVGCEIAEVYSALGAKITIVEMMDHILPAEDAEMARRLEAVLKRKGIGILTATRVMTIDKSNQGTTVTLDGERKLQADQVLMAVGRRPNVDGLGLDSAGVAFDRKGITVDAHLRTSAPGIYAVGDVTGKYMLAHVAMAQGVAAAENACGVASEIDYSAIPRCVYTDPEYAAVGWSEEEASRAGAEPRVYKLRLGRIGRALTLGETFGLAKIICDGPGGRVIGFQVLAPHASELVAEVGLAIKQGLTAEAIARVVHPHPTLSEIVWEASAGAAGKSIHG
ncbi:MAG TPA: dihydrolipoyl dehydrogenase, partial [bacterium]|nr:dihydrolipoyl dehydrogenase [bacterium]